MGSGAHGGPRFRLSIGAVVARRSVFARKNYFYPDLPKGYQDPVSTSCRWSSRKAWESCSMTAPRRSSASPVLISRRMRASHCMRGLGSATGIDLNRAGTPLLEIVSSPTCVQQGGSGIHEKDPHPGALSGNLRRQHARGLISLRRQCLSGRAAAINSAPARNQKFELLSVRGKGDQLLRSRGRSSCSRAAVRCCRRHGCTIQTTTRLDRCAPRGGGQRLPVFSGSRSFARADRRAIRRYRPGRCRNARRQGRTLRAGFWSLGVRCSASSAQAANSARI